MRLLMISDGVLPDRVSGSYRYLWELCQALTIRGHQCHVLVPKARPSLPTAEVIDGITIHRAPEAPGGGLRRFLSRPQTIAASFRDITSRTRFDLICTHWAYVASALRRCQAWRQTPRVAFFYGPWGEEFAYRFGRHRPAVRAAAAVMRRLERGVVRDCSEVVVLSQYSKDQLEATHGVPPSRIHVVPPGVDLARFSPAADRRELRRRMNLHNHAKIAVSVRRLDKRTGLDLLLSAWKSVIIQNNSIMLLLLGRGPDEDRLRSLAGRWNLTAQTQFVGFVPDAELPRYYQVADVSVMPSIGLEGFGLSTLESLACGTPVIGTRVCALPEVLAPLSEGLLAEPSAVDLGRVIAASLGEQASLPSRAACREHVERHYRWEGRGEGIEEVLQGAREQTGTHVPCPPHKVTGIH